MMEYLPLTLEFQKQGKRWTAYCDELGTATFGRSLFEAKCRLKEAILLHLDTLDDVGELNRFLNDFGIQPYY
jgi:predicted RNase H-like HicB family nuclease